MADPTEPAPKLNATEARGGSPTKANRNILVISVGLVLIAFIVIYMMFG